MICKGGELTSYEKKDKRTRDPYEKRIGQPRN